MQSTGISARELTDTLMAFFVASMRTGQTEIFKIVDEHDLSMTQLKILMVLDGAEGELAVYELARTLGLSAAATCRAVDRLARQEVLSRRRDDTDRRVKRIALTASGRAIADRILAARREGLVELVTPLEPEQRAAISDALQPLLAVASPAIPPIDEDSR